MNAYILLDMMAAGAKFAFDEHSLAEIKKNVDSALI